jgi:demethylmenaquinone methyltransferase/2-methoxy-6-polyprenyl-1,4-benzoquinol methylase
MIIEPSPTPEKRVAIQKMFGRIAQNYDLLNKIISIGQDGKWRDALVRIIDPERNQIYLDIGCGTGDLAEGIVKKQPEAVVVAADFSSQMVRVGKTKSCKAGKR